MDQISKNPLNCPNCGASISEDCVCCSYCKTALIVTACPSCFGAVINGTKFCSSCGTAIKRHEIKNQKSLTCPRCEHMLSSVQIGNAAVNECSSCGGLWLNHDTFQNICDEKEDQETALNYTSLKAAPNSPSVSESKRMYVPCPECGELMHRKNFAVCSGVIIDWCKSHGTWFDYQELQQIISFIRSGGLSKARKIEMDKLKEEQERLQRMKANNELECRSILNNPSYSDDDDEIPLFKVLSAINKLFFG